MGGLSAVDTGEAVAFSSELSDALKQISELRHYGCPCWGLYSRGPDSPAAANEQHEACLSRHAQS